MLPQRNVNPQKVQAEALIERAITDTGNEEEMIVYRLEVCDWISQQKRDGPSTVTEILLTKINQRNEKIALLALELLDTCVKNCGFPFHLQIASKRFLNELVKSFPERPPAHLNPVHSKILRFIQIWRSSLCSKSRYKDDLQLIADMYKLLKTKGYTFPRVKDPNSSLVVTNEILLNEEELEEQDKKAQEAKLAELLRRGTQQDLIAANDLMKIIAGHEAQTDYKVQVEDQLNKLEQLGKDTIALLNSIQPGEDVTLNRKLQELIGNCRVAHPKVQKYISEEKNEERIEKLLALNDTINGIFESYDSLKAIHDPSQNEREIPQESNVSTYVPETIKETPPKVTKPEEPLISLIDFDSEPVQQNTGPTFTDFFQKPSTELSPLQSQNGTSNTTNQPFQPQSDFNQTNFTPQNHFQPDFSSNFPPQQNFPLPQQNLSPTLQQNGFQQQPNLDLNSNILQQNQPVQTPTFSESIAASVINKNGLEIVAGFQKMNGRNDLLRIQLKIINHLPLPFTDFQIQLAVPKNFKLKLDALSSTTIPASSINQPVTQDVYIENTSNVQLRIRYKVSYKLGGQEMNDQGEFANIPQL